MRAGVIFLLLALSLWVAPAFAGNTPRYQISYEEFERLVKESVKRVPELEPLWALPSGERQGVALGGGNLRDILRALDTNLREKGAKPAPLPHFSLMRDTKPGADHDIWVPETNSPTAQKVKSMYPGWDILDRGFYDASVKVGGTTLEKLRVTPEGIEDPYGSLKKWYQGEIDFHLGGPETLAETSSRLIAENSHTVLALRFLRFQTENPDFEVTKAAKENLRAIFARETVLPKANYFIHKTLAKLFQANGKDVGKTIQQLSEAGVIGNLTNNGYRIGDIKAIDRNLISFEQFNDHFHSILQSNLDHAGKIEAVRFYDQPWGMLRLMYFTQFTFGDEYRESLEEFRDFVKKAKSLDEVAALLDFDTVVPAGPYHNGDEVERWQALLKEVPELKTLPVLGDDTAKTLKRLIGHLNETPDAWPGLSAASANCAPQYAAFRPR